MCRSHKEGIWYRLTQKAVCSPATEGVQAENQGKDIAEVGFIT